MSPLDWLEPSINSASETATLKAEKAHALIDKQVEQIIAEIKNFVPDDKQQIVKQLEDLIKDRIIYTARDVYRFGFEDAYRMYK